MFGKLWNQTVHKVRTTASEVQQQLNQTAARAKEAIAQYGKLATAQQLEKSLVIDLASITSVQSLQELCDRWLRQIVLSTDPHALRYENIPFSTYKGSDESSFAKSNKDASKPKSLENTTSSENTNSSDSNVSSNQSQTIDSSNTASSVSISSTAATQIPSSSSETKVSETTTTPLGETGESSPIPTLLNTNTPATSAVDSTLTAPSENDQKQENSTYVQNKLNSAIQEDFLAYLISDSDLSILNKSGGGNLWFQKNLRHSIASLSTNQTPTQTTETLENNSSTEISSDPSIKKNEAEISNNTQIHSSLTDLLNAFISKGMTFKQVFLKSDILERLVYRIFLSPEVLSYINGPLESISSVDSSISGGFGRRKNSNSVSNGTTSGVFDDGFFLRQCLLKLFNECLMGGEVLHRQILSLLMTMDPSWKGHVESIIRLISLLKYDWKYERLLDLRRLMLDDMIQLSAFLGNWQPPVDVPNSPNSNLLDDSFDIENDTTGEISSKEKKKSDDTASKLFLKSDDSNEKVEEDTLQKTDLDTNNNTKADNKTASVYNNNSTQPPAPGSINKFSSSASVPHTSSSNIYNYPTSQSHAINNNNSSEILQAPQKPPPQINGLTHHNIRILTSKRLIQLHQLLEANIQKSAELRKLQAKIVHNRLKSFVNKMVDKQAYYQDMIKSAAGNQKQLQDESILNYNEMNKNIEELTEQCKKFDPRLNDLLEKKQKLLNELAIIDSEITELNALKMDYNRNIDKLLDKQSQQQNIFTNQITTEKTQQLKDEQKLADIHNILIISDESQQKLSKILYKHSYSLKQTAHILQDPILKLLLNHLAYEKDRLLYQNMLIPLLNGDDDKYFEYYYPSNPSVPTQNVNNSLSKNFGFITKGNNVFTKLNNNNNLSSKIEDTEVEKKTLTSYERGVRTLEQVNYIWNDFRAFTTSCEKIFSLPMEVNTSSVLTQKVYDQMLTEPSWESIIAAQDELLNQNENSKLTEKQDIIDTQQDMKDIQHDMNDDTQQDMKKPDDQMQQINTTSSNNEKSHLQQNDAQNINFKTILDELETLAYMLKDHISVINNIHSDDIKEENGNQKVNHSSSILTEKVQNLDNKNNIDIKNNLDDNIEDDLDDDDFIDYDDEALEDIDEFIKSHITSISIEKSKKRH